MNRVIFISATDTNIGKTHIGKHLIEKISKLGYAVSVFKPIETGVKELPLDAKILYEEALKYNKDLKGLTLDDIAPITFKLPAAPFVAKQNKSIDLDQLKESFNKIAKLGEVVLIEGAGGLLTPIDENLFMIDLAKMFGAKVLLVVPDGLGCINQTLVNIHFLKSNNINFIWAINSRSNSSFENISKPFFDKMFDDYILLPKDFNKLIKNLMEK